MGAASIDAILSLFDGCEREATTTAIEAGILRAGELVKVAKSSPTRAEARDFFNAVGHHADALVEALLDARFAAVVGSDIRGFAGMTASNLAVHLTEVANIAKCRASLIGVGPGNYKFASELGYPPPKLFIATFVVMLRECVYGKKPDNETERACTACHDIWSRVEGTYSESGDSQGDPAGSWSSSIREARKWIKDSEPPPKDLRSVTDRHHFAVINAIFFVNDIIRSAGLRP